MKQYKKILAALLAVLMMVSLCACVGGNEPADKDEDTTTKPTTTTTTKADDGKVTYTVKVLDDAGAPVVGAFVQICKEACIPAPTNADGVATWTVAEDDYKVSFAVPPAGYEVESEYHFEDGSRDLTITIKKVG